MNLFIPILRELKEWLEFFVRFDAWKNWQILLEISITNIDLKIILLIIGLKLD